MIAVRTALQRQEHADQVTTRVISNKWVATEPYILQVCIEAAVRMRKSQGGARKGTVLILDASPQQATARRINGMGVAGECCVQVLFVMVCL